MNNYKERAEKLSKQIEDKKTEKVRLEERLKSLKEEETKLVSQMEEMGIENVDKLSESIKELETEIETELVKCEKILNEK